MDLPLLHAARVLPEEPERVVGPPSAVPDPRAEEVILPRDVVSRALRSVDGARDLVSQLTGHPLVGVEDEDPGKGCHVDARLFLLRIALPPDLGYFVGVPPGDLGGPVGAEVIDDDDFREIPHAVEGVADVPLLVLRDDDDGSGDQ
ncbi:MAG: hypothetical protein MZV64_71410 [Ignavibacteriales bacterium]|nr:hypothetical protein [Ignavibacteriales bacterium]